MRLYYFHLVLVNTLSLAKPEKGRQAEAMLLQMAQTGQISSRMNEDDLVINFLRKDLSINVVRYFLHFFFTFCATL
jgi:DNA-binding TFAR19-related protein (PDSD5 family)